MTKEEIDAVIEGSRGSLTDWDCRTLVHWMMGYMRYSTNIDAARQAFFTEIDTKLKNPTK